MGPTNGSEMDEMSHCAYVCNLVLHKNFKKCLKSAKIGQNRSLLTSLLSDFSETLCEMNPALPTLVGTYRVIFEMTILVSGRKLVLGENCQKPQKSSKTESAKSLLSYSLQSFDEMDEILHTFVKQAKLHLVWPHWFPANRCFRPKIA